VRSGINWRIKHWRKNIRFFSPAIKEIYARKFLRKRICARNFAIMQQPGSVALVPLPVRDLPRRAINGGLDASGKSPAYSHRRNNQPAPGNRPRDFLRLLTVGLHDAFKKILQRALAKKRYCLVGQITGILTSSQQSSPRRKTGRGLFESDGGRIFRTPHPPMQRIDARRVLIELPSEPIKLSMIPGNASRLS
jgi:hypothetical protein